MAATLVGQTIGFGAGKLAKGHVLCFVEGTEVAVEGEHGLAGKPIEQIEVGDLVWSRNEHTGEQGYKPVVTLSRNTTDTLVHLTYTSSAGVPPAAGADFQSAPAAGTAAIHTSTHTLTGTPEHPFWSITRNAWVSMGELQPGETLQLAGGQTATATSVRTEHLATPVAVYNFEVAGWHTYHVGTAKSGWVFVHNKCGPAHKARQKHIQQTAGGRTERPIPLANGRRRIADNIDAQGRIHQIGDMRTRGGFRPSARERAAIEDIRKARPDATIIFHDKQGRLPSLINPDLQPNWRAAPPKRRYNS
ncbi:MAG: hypothetical protein IPK87_15815 [Planctomycetes bacterium]|nr:hypothetical protein [Planctomycetota bacterium]